MHFRLSAFMVMLTIFSVEAISSRYDEPYPTATSKKGLQVEIVEDALALGIKHATFNFNLCNLIDPKGDTNNPSWTLDGQKFHFRRATIERMDERIKALSERGVLIHLIVLTYQSAEAEVNRLMIHPRCITNAPNSLGAFNTVTSDGQLWLRATMEFCAERWSRPDRKFGRVVGYIMGNEVNSHWWWSNMGRVSMKDFADDYLRTVRLAHTAIRKQSSSARVYLSLEHHWNTRYAAGDDQQSFPAREFIDYFNRRAKETGDFDWHIAFHPYPENLFEPSFWNDKTATTNENTPRITFKNIELLPAYLRRPKLLFEGKPRRIILSEQGFHTPNTPDGEDLQAAAFCFAYKKIEKLEGIDAFILHRHVDHSGEGGLLLGLRRNDPPQSPKKIYEVFYNADTPEWEKTFNFALPIVGLKDWK